MSLLADTFYLGANAKVQAVRFALCLALGLAAGIIALLYLRKARPVERALTDFFATVCIGGLFIVCLEFFLDGKFELYGLAAFVLGIVPIPLIARKHLSGGKKHPSSDLKQADSDEKRFSGNNNRTIGNEKYRSADKKTSSVYDDNDKPYDYEADAYDYVAVAYEKPEDDITLK